MDPRDFQLRFKARAPQLMWFLGAGASASAGIKTAGQMILEFKRRLYCVERRINESRLPEVMDDATQQQIQSVLDQTKRFPVQGTNEEYSAYFEVTHPSQADRQQYIDRQIRDGKPSYGHLGLAALLSVKRCPIVWTTNFDPMVEQAFGNVVRHLQNPPALLQINLSNADEARRAIDINQHPTIIKLHGDYQSVKLMNTSEELKEQDNRMRKALIRACEKYGLVIVGYSGRDDSIMDTLEAALSDKENFSGGIFWISRPQTKPLPRVSKFIADAKALGIDAAIVEIDTFDEMMGDILRLETDLPESLNEVLQDMQPPVTDVVLPNPGMSKPLVRLNALNIIQYPNICRLVPVADELEGDKVVQPLVQSSEGRVLARRFKGGIIAFGSDSNLKETFKDCISGNFDFYPFQKISSPSGYMTQEHRLVMDALLKAIEREGFVEVSTWHGIPILLEKGTQFPNRYQTLKNTVGGPLSGSVNGFYWREGVELKLEFRASRLWLILNPVVWLEAPPQLEELGGINLRTPISKEYSDAREFTRQRRLKRYNRVWNNILEAWLFILFENEDQKIFKTFDLTEDGSDAIFSIRRQTSYSFRLK